MVAVNKLSICCMSPSCRHGGCHQAVDMVAVTKLSIWWLSPTCRHGGCHQAVDRVAVTKLSYTSSADSPFSLMSSFTLSNHLFLGLPLPSPLYFHYHRPPSYVVFLSSHHTPIPHQPYLLYIVCDFPHFCCHSYSFISDRVQLRNSAHPS